MLKDRILSAIALLAFIFAALFLFNPFYFSLTVGLATTLAVWEWTQFADIRKTFWRLFVSAVFGCFLFVWIYSSQSYLNAGRVFINVAQPILLIAVIWWVVALCFVVTYPKSAKLWSHSTFLQFIFGACTLVPFFVAVLKLRLNEYIGSSSHGIILLLYVFILVWAADSGAYFAGRAFGKHKLAPKVSPGKTWEGVVGGLISAAILAFVFVKFVAGSAFQVPMHQFILLSIVTVAVSILGDLTESMFKRDVGIKDSSHLIPGHGGVLDRIDSLAAAVPFFAFFYFYVL